MSEFKKYPSEYKDLDCLKTALAAHGCTEIETYTTPTALKGYWGRNTKVDVRAVTAQGKEFGFIKSTEGPYDAMNEEDG
jgi:hypothetical protein